MDMKYFKTIRGDRILSALYEETLTDLERNIVQGFPNTKKRQHATDPVHIVHLKITPYIKTGDLLIETLATSDGKKYDQKIMFPHEVKFEDNDTNENVTFTASDNQTYNMQPLSLSGATVRVRCSCLDFRYRFSVWNNAKDALYGEPFPPFRRTSNRPPVNPDRVPGLCKHIIKAVEALTQAGIIE